jgi:hypothetical protein
MRIRCIACLIASLLVTASLAFAQGGIGPITTSVPKAKKAVGHPGTTIAQGFMLKKIVDGSFALENPSGPITTFGNLSTGEATEPDENTYLVLDHNPGGPVPGFDYGRHFLFQGHELFSGDLAYFTRVNLDVKDPVHKITLLTPVGANGKTGLNDIDGSTYDPFTNTVLFTSELGAPGGVFEIGVNWPSSFHNLDGILGKAGYEGIHPDDLGNLILVEDVGGTSVNVNPADPASPKVARRPNSFVYRFLPYDVTDLSQGGKLQALTVTVDGTDLVFNNDAVAAVFAFAQVRLHTPGTSYPCRWVTIHDTAVSTDPFDANAAAKAAGATPFKRPENAQFLPGSAYRTFFFTPTGDTNADAGTVDLAQRGSWGSIFRVDLAEDRNTGTISIFVLGDADHAAFDNLTFGDDHTILAAEDRGNGLHSQLNKLDSVWAYATDGSLPPRRFVALGRDPVSEATGEDNEPTGIHVSNGSPLATDQPGSLSNLINARGFLTRQHGQNQVWEIIKKF